MLKCFNRHEGITGRRNWIGLAAAIGLVGAGLGLGAVAAADHNNLEAAKTEQAARIVRTNEWLERRNLNVDSSTDMMKALILACDEIKSRGERC